VCAAPPGAQHAALQAQLLVKAGAHPPVRHEEIRNPFVDRREHAFGHVVKARRIGLLLLFQYKAPRRVADVPHLRLAIVRATVAVIFDGDHHHFHDDVISSTCFVCLALSAIQGARRSF